MKGGKGVIEAMKRMSPIKGRWRSSSTVQLVLDMMGRHGDTKSGFSHLRNFLSGDFMDRQKIQ